MLEPKYNGGVVNYDGTNVTVKCAFCGEHTSSGVSGFTAKLNENGGDSHYDNLKVECGTCGALTIVNLNIPEGEYDELDVEPDMPFFELNARKHVRDLMWDKRADLKRKSRDAHLKRTKAKLDAFKATAKEAK